MNKPELKQSLAFQVRRVIFAISFLFVFAIGVMLRINNLNNVSTRSPDEKIYTFQAKAIAQNGIGAIKSLVQEYNSNKELWFYPTPIRVGYLWLLADVMKITKNTSEKIGAYISCVFSIISLLLLILIGLRFFNPWIALYALLFTSVSPMDLAIARRTWQDAMLGCFGLGLVYLCCEITHNAHKLIWYILFIVLGSYCILIKESGILIYGLCLFWILYVLLLKEKSYLKGFFLILSSAMGISISIIALAYNAGGITPILDVLRHAKETMPLNQYAIEYQSGPWYHFLQAFWFMSPFSAFFYIISIVGIILPKEISQKFNFLPNYKNRNIIFIAILFFMAAFMATAIAMPYCINLRYVSVLFVPFYLISGLGFWHVVSFAKPILNKFSFYVVAIFIIIGVSFAAINDYRNFKKMFVTTDSLDVSIKMIKEYSH